MSAILDSLSQYGDVTKYSLAPRAWKLVRKMPTETIQEVVTFDAKETFLFVTSANDGFSDQLAVAILATLQRHRDKALAADPLALIDGLEDPRGRFGTLAVLSKSAARKYLEPSLAKITQIAFPIYRCELSGDEDAELLKLMIGRYIRILEWNRKPNPVTWMKFVNTKTAIRSINKNLGLAMADDLYEQVSSMRKTGSFVEVMNFKKQRMRIEADKGRCHVSFDEGGETDRIVVEPRDAVAAARSFLERGLP
jgi:hypothetical protein